MLAHGLHGVRVEKGHLPLEVRLVAEVTVATQSHAGDTLDFGDSVDAMVKAPLLMTPAEIVSFGNPKK